MTFGVFSKIKDITVIDMMLRTNIDFIILDQEHGIISTRELESLSLLPQEKKDKIIVRLKSSSTDFTYLLDLGFKNLMIPNVKDTEEIHEVMSRAFFQPAGTRGLCKYVPAANHGEHGLPSYLRFSKEVRLFIQFENDSIMSNIRDFQEYVDRMVAFVGPYDLSKSLGVIGQVDSPKVLARINRFLEDAVEIGMRTGIYLDSKEKLKNFQHEIDYVAIGVDINYLRLALNEKF